MLTRSAFLQRLIPLIGLGRLTYRQAQGYRKIYLFQSFVAGFRFYRGMELLPMMGVNDPLELRREPENEYDSFAIALYWQEEKIGFLPAANNEMIARLLDAEALPLLAFITHINYEVQPWENIAVAVCHLQPMEKQLAPHAFYLTTLQSPMYSTKRRKKQEILAHVSDRLPHVLETDNRVIALESIDDPEVQDYFKRHYFDKAPLTVGGKPFALVSDDGIYNYMYQVEGKQWVQADDGKEYLEFTYQEQMPWE
jgi:hypothetical protein